MCEPFHGRSEEPPISRPRDLPGAKGRHLRITSEQILAGPIAPVLRRMTTPMVVGIFVMITFQTVDTYFLSLLGTAELAAISFTFPVSFTVTNLAIGLGIAMSVLVGKAIGEGRHNKAARITTEALLLSFVIVAIVATLGIVTIDPLFRLLGASESTLLLIHEYLDIWYVFVVLLVVPMLCNSAIRATGDTKWPSILMMVAGLVNVIFDPILIFGLGPVPAMGMKGAAWATVISWAFGFVAAFWLLWRREKLLVFSLPPAGELLTVWKRMLALAMPISLANMLAPVAIAILTAMVARYGEHAVAAFGVGGRFEAFSLVVAFALTSALSPYMAQNLGARNYQRADQALRTGIRFIVIFQLVVYLLLVLAAPLIAAIFSRDPAVIAVSTRYLRIMPLGAAFYAIVIVLNTAFNAHHRSRHTLNLSLFRVFLLIVPLAWLGGRHYAIPGLFVGAVTGNALAALIGWRIYLRMQRDAGHGDDPAVEA